MKLCPMCMSGHHGAPERCSVCQADLAGIPLTDGQGLTGMFLDDKYEIIELLDEGGMAWVYRAMHLGLDRSVAIKVLKHEEHTGTDAAARFEREARLLSRLNHPHVVTVIDFGRTKSGMLYLVTELVKGKTLGEVLRDQEAMPLSRVYNIIHQVFAAIEEAHGAGVIHRDLKPDNILVMPLSTGEDFVKVVDFGISGLVDDTCGDREAASRFAGTPGYMSPEQINCEPTTTRSDIYSLGVLLYEMLAGRVPFEHESPVMTMSMQLTKDHPPLSATAVERGLPTALDRLMERVMAKEPADRPGSVSELRRALTEVFAEMGPLELSCDQCTRPINPETGLCSLHGAVAPLAEKGAVAGSRPLRDAARTRQEQTAPWDPEMTVSLADAICGSELFSRQLEAGEISAFLAGPGTMMEIVGEPGIGKSALLDGVERAASHLGMPILRTGPDPLGAPTPWYPVRDLVGQVLGCGADPSSQDLLRDLAGEKQLEDAVAQGLTLLFGLPSPVPPSSNKESIDRVHTSGFGTIMRLASDSDFGVCVLVDDADEVDRASRDFLRAATMLGPECGVKLFVCSVHGVAREIGEHPVIELGPLSRAGTELLVARHLEADPRADKERVREMARAVYRNPLHALQAAGLVREGGEPRGSLMDVVNDRLQRLPPDSLEVLRAASAYGREVPRSALKIILGEDQLSLSLSLLEQRGMLRAVGSDKPVYPAHAVLARAALDSMRTDERSRLHARVLEVLDHEHVSPFVLARHAEEAGSWERALDLRELAGDQARQLGDDEDAALVHYLRAAHIARWELLMAEDSKRYLELSLKMGSAMITSGHLLGAEVMLKRITQSAGRHPHIAEQAGLQLASMQRIAGPGPI